MLAYLFWHVPRPEVGTREYETALSDFLADLARVPPPGLASCATYRISAVPWLGGQRRYEDWYFVQSSADLDALNEAAVRPERWEVHACIARMMESGHGGLYRHLRGEEQPLSGEHVAWLTRPRGIRYEQPLQDIIGRAAGFTSCWRRQMVLGPGAEFIIVGTSPFNAAVPDGWQARPVERTRLVGAA